MRIEIDYKAVSSFKKIKDETKDKEVKKKLEKIDKALAGLIKDYVIDAATDKHYIEIEDDKKEEAEKILKAIGLVAEGKVTDAFVVMGL